MSSAFNPDDNDIPHFGSRVYPEAFYSFAWFAQESHVPGRHLNALLNAEDAAGIVLDEDAVDKHARAAFFSYSGPVPLPLNRHEMGGPLVHFVAHNVREGFHALYALCKYRRSERAMELAERSIAAIFRLWDPAKGWDKAYLEGQLGLQVTDWEFITGLARAIGPLVKLYRATGHAPALELAIHLKNKVTAEFFTASGTYDRATFGTHCHSTTCVMSGLAQLADLLGDAALLERVKAFYDNGLWAMRDALGWCLEGTRDDSMSDLGEINNSGDILETALILGHWGHTECYQDAERILRGHILPSQLRDISFIPQTPNPQNEDAKRDVAQRHLGGFGFPAPYGHWPADADPKTFGISFNMDIVGGGVGSLCEALREVARTNQAGTWVNLLFDHETPNVQVQSPYTQGAFRVRAKKPGALFVRIPSWVKPEMLHVDRLEESEGRSGDRRSTSGAEQPWRMTNGYAMIAQPPVNRWVTLTFPLIEQELVLKHRARDIRVRLRGDAVQAMDNFCAPFSFFELIEGEL